MKAAFARMKRGLAVLVAAALLVPVAVVPAFAADGTFTGGPSNGHFPAVMPNDYTPQTVRFGASGLEPGASYYVKMRLVPEDPANPGIPPTLGGQGALNRGFIWNGTLKRWVRNKGEDWSAYPTIAADGSGVITSSDSSMFFFCVGNEATSGNYYLFVSLNKVPGADGSTLNCDVPKAVTIVDMKTGGSWAHNGLAGPGTDFRRVSLNASGASGNQDQVLSISRNETNTVDDDLNGVVDDEDIGPAGKTGDYRLAGVAGSLVDVYNQTTLAFDDAYLGLADEDVALGAAEMSAPTKPTGLAATASTSTVSLKWTPAADNTAVTGYRVYRWVESNSTEYTNPHVFLGSSVTTGFVDTKATPGVQYKYEVRAFDAATNVGARSDSAGAMIIPAAPSSYAATLTPNVASGKGGWYTSAPKVSIEATADAFYKWAGDTAYTAYTAPITAPAGINTLVYYAKDGFGTSSAIKQLTVKVDGTAPTATLVAPAISTAANTGKSFTVSWSGSDAVPGSGVATYTVDYKKGASGAWKTWYAGKDTEAVFTGSAGSTYYFRVNVVDNAGNLSAWSAESSTMVPYDNTSLSFKGKWAKIKSASYYNGYLRRSKASKASASMKFTGGSAAYLVTATGKNRGKVKVYVDGKYKRTVSLYSKTAKSRKSIWVANLKGSGKHTIKFVRVSVKKRPYVAIDGLAVKR